MLRGVDGRDLGGELRGDEQLGVEAAGSVKTTTSPELSFSVVRDRDVLIGRDVLTDRRGDATERRSPGGFTLKSIDAPGSLCDESGGIECKWLGAEICDERLLLCVAATVSGKTIPDVDVLSSTLCVKDGGMSLKRPVRISEDSIGTKRGGAFCTTDGSEGERHSL